MLQADLSEVGLVLRPGAEVIHHRLADKLPDLKEHLHSVYGTKVAVNLMPAPAAGEETGPDEMSAGSVATADLLPVEKLIMDLFKAKPVQSQGPNN